MIVLVAPEAGNRLTGGHLVNAQLSRFPEFRLLGCRSLGECAGRLDHALPDVSAVLVDSLFLTDPEGLLRLRRRLASPGGSARARLGLIAHSLPSLIPGPPAFTRAQWASSERRALAALDLAVAPSRFMALALARRGMPEDRIRLVTPAPVVDGRQPPGAGRSAPRALARNGSGPVRVLTVANWGLAKGIDRLLTALRSASDLQWHWMIIGEWRNDDYGRSLYGAMRAEREEGLVTVMDPREPERLRSAYSETDLFALPSLMESYGLVFAEALTFGLPVLALRAAAVPETVGGAGVLVPAGDQVALTRHLRALLSDGTLRADLARCAAGRARELPDWEQTRRGLLEAVGNADAGGLAVPSSPSAARPREEAT